MTTCLIERLGTLLTKRHADMNEVSKSRKNLTVIILALIALSFYIAIFAKYW